MGQFAKETSLYNNQTASWTAANLTVASGATAAFNVGGTGEFTSADIDTLKGLSNVVSGTPATQGFKSGSNLGLDTTNAGGNFTYASTITNHVAGATIDRLGLTKLGTGILTLTGANTYTGATTVTRGIVAISGAGSINSGTTGSLLIGQAAGNNAVVNYSSSGTSSFLNINLGGNATASGAMNISAGIINTNPGGNYVEVGQGGYGSLSLSGGSLAVNGSSGMRVGDGAAPTIGVFNQSGGTVTLSRYLALGLSGSTGQVNLTGGTFNGATGYSILIGNNGASAAILNVGTMAGGNATLVANYGAGGTTNNGIVLGQAATASGLLNLNSGTIQMNAGSITNGNSTGGSTVNLNGGTIKAGATGLTLLGATSGATTPFTVNVYNGGVTVDTNGLANSTITANLLATTGNGVYGSAGVLTGTSPITAGGAGYIGAPIVTVSGGSGSGITAVAMVSGGVVTGIQLTNPGNGYVAGDILSLTLAGGGPSTAATVSTYTLGAGDIAANTAGGLTKNGTGTLTITGNNTYTGLTTVSGGTLLVNGSTGIGAVTVGSTASLGGTGSLAGAAIVQSGGSVAPGAGVGNLSFGSTVNLQSGSSYAAEIASAASNDKITASGTLTVNGTIKVTLLGGYSPAVNTVFDLADAAIAGTPVFDFTAAALGAGLTWDTTAFATDGTIKVVVGSADPFTAWATANSVTGGKGGDDDKDGVKNLLEFATASNPQSGSSGARAYPLVQTIGGVNVLTYTVAVRAAATFAASGSKQQADKDQVGYTVEASDQLGTWNSVVVTELAAPDADAVQAALGAQLSGLDPAWTWHSFRTDGDTASDPGDFIRLVVTETP
ncbi:MAG: autotransporter-associated beta strand repeat-containing protein [Luteolibacter sp.]